MLLTLICAVLGTLSGLGVGGGSILMLWLTAIEGLTHGAARLLNLLFFLPSALIASWFHRKQGRLPLKKLWPGILSGCLFAVGFSWLGGRLDTSLMQKLFGGLLIVTGIRELFYRAR